MLSVSSLVVKERSIDRPRTFSFLKAILLGCVWSSLLIANAAHSQFEADDGNSFEPTENEVPAGTFVPSEEFRSVQTVKERQFSTQLSNPPVAGAPANPTKGPNDLFVYQNSNGTWKLPPANQIGAQFAGAAQYEWFDGSKHTDKLTYIAHGFVTDQGGFIIPQGTKVSVWVFMSSDNNGNSIFFYMGTTAIINAPQGKRYPMYYSWSPPGMSTTVIRFVTETGTTRF